MKRFAGEVTGVKFVASVSLLLLCSSQGFSALPSSTGTEHLWVSENATDFWVMNDPVRLNNDISVFHYNSDFELVERIDPWNFSPRVEINDIARTDNGKWVVLLGRHNARLKVFNSSWTPLGRVEIDEHVDAYYSSLNEKNGTLIVNVRTEEELEQADALSWKFDDEDMRLYGKKKVQSITPDQYPPEEDEWIKYRWFEFKNRSQKVGSEQNLTVDEPVRSQDGQVRNGSIWLLENTHAGGKVHEYTLNMEPTGNVHDVGLNESQIKEEQDVSAMAIAGIFWAIIIFGGILIFLLAIGLLIYQNVKETD